MPPLRLYDRFHHSDKYAEADRLELALLRLRTEKLRLEMEKKVNLEERKRKQLREYLEKAEAEGWLK